MKRRKSISSLLNAIRDDWPRSREEAEQLIHEREPDTKLVLTMQSPQSVTCLPTFDEKKFHPLSPMLKERYEHSGEWNFSLELWLSPLDMAAAMRKEAVKSYHKALREHWEKSCPMLYPDDRLTLYGYVPGVATDLTYLVWPENSREPEVWEFAQFDLNQFANLAEYLEWVLTAE